MVGCRNNGTCTNTDGSYQCRCDAYYTGAYCEEGTNIYLKKLQVLYDLSNAFVGYLGMRIFFSKISMSVSYNLIFVKMEELVKIFAEVINAIVLKETRDTIVMEVCSLSLSLSLCIYLFL